MSNNTVVLPDNTKSAWNFLYKPYKRLIKDVRSMLKSIHYNTKINALYITDGFLVNFVRFNRKTLGLILKERYEDGTIAFIEEVKGLSDTKDKPAFNFLKQGYKYVYDLLYPQDRLYREYSMKFSSISAILGTEKDMKYQANVVVDRKYLDNIVSNTHESSILFIIPRDAMVGGYVTKPFLMSAVDLKDVRYEDRDFRLTTGMIVKPETRKEVFNKFLMVDELRKDLAKHSTARD